VQSHVKDVMNVPAHHKLLLACKVCQSHISLVSRTCKSTCDRRRSSTNRQRFGICSFPKHWHRIKTLKHSIAPRFTTFNTLPPPHLDT
jgi:hypothetical protein